MQKTLRKLFLLSFLFWFSGNLLALNPPPANDSAWGAGDLGLLPIPPVCPSGGYGNAVTVTGSTIWASYNTFDFSPAHCFPGGSPDVWYRFTSSASSIIIDASGFNGLDTFFVKLFYSQGSCFSLVPLACETSVGGFITINYQTPAIGEEYYLQIGGNEWYKTGDYSLTIKSLNICNECVNESGIMLDPAPWFGRYGTDQAVKMCYTVDRWDYLGSADIHGIVPRFGIDWDISTLMPLVAPQSYSANNGWHWFSGVNTPDGPGTGYFFDPDNDGDPSNNAGDSAGILSSWTGCWEIKTLPYCNVYDLHVDINAYCDNQTGTGISLFACDPSPPLHLGIVGWCCPSPTVSVISPLNCSGTATVTITGMGNAGDLFNYSVYDTGYSVVGFLQNATGPFTLALPPGEYNVEAYNATDGCIAYTTLVIPPYLEVEMTQTVMGCGSGTSEAVAMPVGGQPPYTYNFSSSQQNDSLAFQVPDGWLVVTVSDQAGCTATDSIWIISEPATDATFDYADASVCVSLDTVFVSTYPPSAFGSYSLISPTGSGISVNPVNGEVYLSNATLNPPYWVYVKYSVGTICYSFHVDSFQVMPTPLPPTVVGNAALNYCIGSPAPSLTVVPGFLEFASWYDNQTTLVYIGSTYVTPLDGNSVPGTYLYGVVSVSVTDFSCVSLPVIFSVNANYPPYFSVSADTTICPGEMATLAAAPCSTCVYSWNPLPTAGPSNTPVTTTYPPSTTTYTITATNPAGCSSSLSTTVNVDQSGSCGLYIYSGITPNGDGHNDIWVIDGIEEYPNAVVSIFNRWGQLVWQYSAYENLAGGRVFSGKDMGGSDLPDGTYYYLITGDGLNVHDWLELSH